MKKLKEIFEVVTMSEDILAMLDVCMPDPRVTFPMGDELDRLIEEEFADIRKEIEADPEQSKIFQMLADNSFITPNGLVEPPTNDPEVLMRVLQHQDALAGLFIKASENTNSFDLIKTAMGATAYSDQQMEDIAKRFEQFNCPNHARIVRMR